MSAIEKLPSAIHLNDAFGVFVLSPDDVEFRTGATSGRSFLASDSERRGLLGSIIEKLLFHQAYPTRPWNQAESDILGELIPELQRNGIVDAKDNMQTMKEDRGGSILRKPLCEARIAILGHGFLGNAVRLLVQRMGCRAITTLESSSVANKSDAAWLNLIGEALSAAPPEVERRPGPADEQGWNSILRGQDWVIGAQDSFEPEELTALNKAALELDFPWSLTCFDGYEGWVGPTFVPGETACFGCFRRRIFAGAAEPKHIFTDPGIKVYRVPSPWVGPETAAWVSLIASIFATEVIAAMNGGGFTLNHMLVVHRLNLTFQRESVLRLPRCEQCSPHRNGSNVNVFAHLLATNSEPAKKQ
jgi:bacteriocin biosynthesis cyclodehydratase domain-containing protein